MTVRAEHGELGVLVVTAGKLNAKPAVSGWGRAAGGAVLGDDGVDGADG